MEYGDVVCVRFVVYVVNILLYIGVRVCIVVYPIPFIPTKAVSTELAHASIPIEFDLFNFD